MVIVITGPTAVGKTKLSIELAKRLNGEIINADSTQVYKNLDIATAKVTLQEMEGVKHHLIDIKDVNEDYTVFEYQKDCRDKIQEILDNKKVPIMVGGTGLYIKAALYDYKFSTDEVNNTYDEYSNQELYDMVLKIDQNSNIHINNRKRLVRFLNKGNKEEIKTDKLLYDTIFIGLTTTRDILYERINNRVDVMINNGLIEEAKKIYESNIRTKAIMTPIGYKELFPYFEKTSSLEECIEKLKQSSRKYAKRQYTWFNHQMDIKWFNVCFDDFSKTINEVYEYIKKPNE